MLTMFGVDPGAHLAHAAQSAGILVQVLTLAHIFHRPLALHHALKRSQHPLTPLHAHAQLQRTTAALPLVPSLRARIVHESPTAAPLLVLARVVHQALVLVLGKGHRHPKALDRRDTRVHHVQAQRIPRLIRALSVCLSLR